MADLHEEHQAAREKAKARRQGNSAAAPIPPILSSSEFVAGFVPPDYLVEGLIQRRYLYAITAHTAAGKTAIALLLCASTALSRSIGGHAVELGRALYLIGENGVDIRMRWIAMGEQMEFNPNNIDVHFMEGVFSLPDAMPKIRQEAEDLGGVDLVVVDTSAAFFPGDDENANVQMGQHARNTRALTTIPGQPCVVTLCHPAKHATDDALAPRGGYAFLAEIDGNLTVRLADNMTTLHWFSKLRGPGFDPISFELVQVKTPKLVDSKGRELSTVIARTISDPEQQVKEDKTRGEEDQILVALLNEKNASASLADLARSAGWFMSDGEPYKMRASRVITRLKSKKLVTEVRDRWLLTPAGKAEAKRISEAAEKGLFK